jgi:hypothetical protein
MNKPDECLLKDEKQTIKLKMRVYQSAMQDTSDEEEQEEGDTYSNEEESSTGSEMS